MSQRTLHLEGRRFGRLVVRTRSDRKCCWICVCDCGVEVEVFMTNLRNGKTMSCGCGGPDDLRRYIEANSIPIPFIGCWMWLGALWNHGYGQIYITGIHTRLAHRVSFHAFKHPPPDDMLVMHSCDNQWCVCPDHLSLGTDRDNTHDMFRKGRGINKLTPDDIKNIRQRSAMGVTRRSVALAFGVSPSLISNIVNGHRHNNEWSNVDAAQTNLS